MRLSEYEGYPSYSVIYDCSETLYINDKEVSFWLENPQHKEIRLRIYIKKGNTRIWNEEDKETYKKDTMEYFSLLIAHNAKVQEAIEVIKKPTGYIDLIKKSAEIMLKKVIQRI